MLPKIKKISLLLPIFITCVFGSTHITQEVSCPENDYKLRENLYLNLNEKSGELCISCSYTGGGQVNTYKYYISLYRHPSANTVFHSANLNNAVF